LLTCQFIVVLPLCLAAGDLPLDLITGLVGLVVNKSHRSAPSLIVQVVTFQAVAISCKAMKRQIYSPYRRYSWAAGE
jgi:hypothetical protein